MSIIGIDYGNRNTKVSHFNNGNFNIIESELNERMYESFICIYDNKRYLHSYAKNKLIKAVDNIQFNIKSKINNDASKEIHLYDKKIMNNSSLLLTMLINNIYKHTLSKIGKKDLYIFTYPDYFSTIEIIKYNLILKNIIVHSYKLIPESIAISLDYGLYKIMKNEFSENKNILFIDSGNVVISYYYVSYINNKIKVNYAWSLKECGSSYMDKLLVQYILNIFKEYLKKNNILIKDDIVLQKCMKKIYIHSENIRKQLNINKKIKYTIESLYNDIDFSIEMNRELYKSIIDPILKKISDTSEIFINNFNIDEVECVGGLSRLIFIKDIFKNKLDHIHNTLNIDESISKGATIYGSNELPIYKNININFEYKYNNSIYLSVNNKVIKLINDNDLIPLNKKCTLPQGNVYIKIFINDYKIISRYININQRNLIIDIGLNKLPNFTIEYKSNNINKIKKLEYDEVIDKHELFTIKQNEKYFIKVENDIKNKKIILNKFEELYFKIDKEVIDINCKEYKIIKFLKKWMEEESDKDTLEICIKNLKILKELYDSVVKNNDKLIINGA